MENNNNINNNNSDSLYSYSYVNQENQERNPNYYEKKEQESSTQEGNTRTYTAGPAGQTYASGTSSQNGTNGQNWYNNTAAEPRKKKEHKKTKKPHGFGMSLAKCAAIALVFGLVSGTVFYGTGYVFDYANGSVSEQKKLETTMENNDSKNDGTTTNSGSLSATKVSTAETKDVSDIVESVMPSIVSITNMGQVTQNFFGQIYSQDTESAGSGIIIGQTDEVIYIATNNHVVANSNQLTVSFIDEQVVTAEIKGTDPSTDLAVISVAIKDIPEETMNQIKVAVLGDSDELKVGQSVIAIGNALGYGQSVTDGIVSAMNREVTVQDEMTGTSASNEMIQTSAAINPGNSGGALVNMNGEVIGINSVKYSDTNVEGMGFAIPVSTAESIINDLITREVVDESESSYLGVAGQEVTGDIAESFGMPEGLYLTQVKEGSPAEAAGIRRGDVITEFDGRTIRSMDDLQNVMQYYAAGTTVEITLQVNQNGEWQEQTVTATLGKKNN